MVPGQQASRRAQMSPCPLGAGAQPLAAALLLQRSDRAKAPFRRGCQLQVSCSAMPRRSRHGLKAPSSGAAHTSEPEAGGSGGRKPSDAQGGAAGELRVECMGGAGGP